MIDSRCPPIRLGLIVVWASLAVSAAQADVTSPDGKKSGFFGRIFGGGQAPVSPAAIETPAPAAPAPAPKPATKPPKPRVTTIAPKSGAVAKKSTSTPARKSASPAVAAKEVPAKSSSASASAAVTASATGGSVKKDSEFGYGGDDDDSSSGPRPTVASAPKIASASNSAALPRSQNGWEIVKLNGRDYITGDSIHRFYRFSSYKVDGSHVWLRSNNLIVKGQIGSMDLLINNIKFVLSYPVAEANGKALFSRLDLCKLIDPVLRPSHITGAEFFDTVVVDAGHGGHDTGARGVYGYEKDFALKMAYAVREALTQRGFKVVMTRTTDNFVTLGGRVAISNNTPRSIFVSLHFNSGGSAATGIETFALTPQGSSASLERGGGYNASGLTGNAHDSANIALATAVHAMVISRFKFVDRGIKRAQWSVLTGCRRPGILFEGGFVTNSVEGGLIASDNYRHSVSNAIADALVNYRKALQPAVTGRR